MLVASLSQADPNRPLPRGTLNGRVGVLWWKAGVRLTGLNDAGTPNSTLIELIADAVVAFRFRSTVLAAAYEEKTTTKTSIPPMGSL
jgi:hypothetical protein